MGTKQNQPHLPTESSVSWNTVLGLEMGFEPEWRDGWERFCLWQQNGKRSKANRNAFSRFSLLVGNWCILVKGKRLAGVFCTGHTVLWWFQMVWGACWSCVCSFLVRQKAILWSTGKIFLIPSWLWEGGKKSWPDYKEKVEGKFMGAQKRGSLNFYSDQLKML